MRNEQSNVRCCLQFGWAVNGTTAGALFSYGPATFVDLPFPSGRVLVTARVRDAVGAATALLSDLLSVGYPTTSSSRGLSATATEWRRDGGQSAASFIFSGSSERLRGGGRRALVPVSWLAVAGGGLDEALRRGRADLVNRQVCVRLISIPHHRFWVTLHVE